MLDAVSNAIIRSFTANDETRACVGGQSGTGSMASLMTGSLANLSVTSPGNVAFMAICGVGLWVSLASSSTVSLYHTESFIHMQVKNIEAGSG